MNDYVGKLEGETIIAPKPFVIKGWPGINDLQCFDSEEEALSYLNRARIQDNFAQLAKIYKLGDGVWCEISREYCE
jgi:hypothetical protein